jgi:hypothetical protein
MEVARLQRYLTRNYNLVNGIEESVGTVGSDVDDAVSDGRPVTAASLGTFLEKLTLDVPLDSGSEHQGQTTDGNTLSHKSSTRDFKPGPSSPLSFSDSPPPHPPKDYAASPISSSRLALPLPALALPLSSTSSVRSSNSNSSVSTGAYARTITGSGATARISNSGSASSLRGLLGARAADKENRKEKKNKENRFVSSNGPPKLDWTPPDLDL